MTTTKNTTKTRTTTESAESGRRAYPSALYAAAGVGDLAYQQLRKLPEVADRLRAKAVELAGEAQNQAPRWRAKATQSGAKATSVAAEFTGKVDPAQVRDVIVTGTQTVADKATRLYSTLVARGEKAFTETAEHTAAQPAQTAADETIAAQPAASQPAASPAEPVKSEAQDAEVKPAAKRQPRGK